MIDMHYVTFDAIIDSCMKVASPTSPTIVAIDGLLIVLDSKLLKRMEGKGFKGKDQELVEINLLFVASIPMHVDRQGLAKKTRGVIKKRLEVIWWLEDWIQNICISQQEDQNPKGGEKIWKLNLKQTWN